MRPFRFIASAPHFGATAREITDSARKAEAVGFHSIVLTDHLLKQYAPIPVLATVAAATASLRIGTFVFNNSLRHPAVLAQDLATLDVLCGGRLDIGIGAGWNRPEYDAIGLPFPSARTRVSQLDEAITVMKGCFATGPFSFSGKHYTITGFDGVPETAQKPHPPFFIGGGGQRVLALAGREADIVGLAPRIKMAGGTDPRPDVRSLTAAATAEKIAWVREAAGERFSSLEFNTYTSGAPLIITDDARTVAAEHADRLEKLGGQRLTAEEVLDSPHIFIGAVEALADKLIALRERFGINSFMLGSVEESIPIVERLADC